VPAHLSLACWHLPPAACRLPPAACRNCLPAYLYAILFFTFEAVKLT
jgi:hypothetical protein